MAQFEKLDKTVFFYPNAQSIAMATSGKEVLRIDAAGHLRLGTSTQTNKLFDPLDDRLKVIGQTQDEKALALNVTNSEEQSLFTVRNDGQISLGISRLKGFEVSSAHGDWIFLRQERQTEGGGGFHIHNPWRDSDGPERNRLEIGYRTQDGREKWEEFVIHGPTGNVGIGTGTPGTDKVRIMGDTNDDTASGLRVTNASGNSLLRVRNDGRVFMNRLRNSSNVPGTLDLGWRGGELVIFTSSRRFKEDILPFKADHEAILLIEPKSFRCKNSGEQAVGLIAEELHELGLHPLVIYDDDKQPYSVNYKLLPVYLLEVIKAHHVAADKLKEEHVELQAELARTQKELHELQQRMTTLESVLQQFTSEHAPAKTSLA